MSGKKSLWSFVQHGAIAGSLCFCGHWFGVMLPNWQLLDFKISLLIFSILSALPFILAGVSFSLVFAFLPTPSTYLRWSQRLVSRSFFLSLLFLIFLSLSFFSAPRLTWSKNHLFSAPGSHDSHETYRADLDLKQNQPEIDLVLLITLDTARRDIIYHDTFGPSQQSILNLAGLPRTKKTLEGWALDVYADAESPSGWTIPSMRKIMHITQGQPTLAELMNQQGYRTAAVVDNMLLLPGEGFAKGFDYYQLKSVVRSVYLLWTYRWYPRAWRARWQERWFSQYAGAQSVTDRAMKLIQSESSQPLFLWLHYMDFHNPLYADSPHQTLPFFRWKQMAWSHQSIDTDVQQKLKEAYRHEGQKVDTEIARLLNVLAGRQRRTVLVLTSDHGEEFFEHGSLSHLHSLHAELTKVPLLVGWNPLAQNALGLEPTFQQINDWPVSTADIWRLVSDLNQFDGPAKIEIRGVRCADQYRVGHAWKKQVRNGQSWLKHEYQGTIRWLAYDLKADPYEQNAKSLSLDQQRRLDLGLECEQQPGNAPITDREGLKAMGYLEH